MQQMETIGAEERGQALVEFALLFTVLTLIIMGVLAFGIILTSQISLVAIAKSAARQANLRNMHLEYCSSAPNDHYNGPIYDIVVNSLGELALEDLDSIMIFQAGDDGNPVDNRIDVLDRYGSLTISSFPNSFRCSDGISIGVEILYNQAVPVPVVDRITGDPITLHARAIMHIE